MHCCKWGPVRNSFDLGSWILQNPNLCSTGTHSCQMTVPHSNCNSTMFSHSRQGIGMQVSENNAVTRITLSLLELILKPQNLLFHISCNISHDTPESHDTGVEKYPFSTTRSRTGRANKEEILRSLELTWDAREHSELPLALKSLSANDRTTFDCSTPSSLVPFTRSWLNSLKFMAQGRSEGVYIKLGFK